MYPFMLKKISISHSDMCTIHVIVLSLFYKNLQSKYVQSFDIYKIFHIEMNIVDKIHRF
jgi:hypothetical protein